MSKMFYVLYFVLCNLMMLLKWATKSFHTSFMHVEEKLQADSDQQDHPNHSTASEDHTDISTDTEKLIFTSSLHFVFETSSGPLVKHHVYMRLFLTITGLLRVSRNSDFILCNSDFISYYCK